MIRIYSFSYMFRQDAFKIIRDCDLIVDCRDLPDPQGKGIGESGLEEEIRNYVFADGRADGILEDVIFRQDLNIAFGCTGGKNRSVSLAEELAHRLRMMGLEDTIHGGWNKIPHVKVIHIGLLEWGIKQ